MPESKQVVQLVWNGGPELQNSPAVLPVQLTFLGSARGSNQSFVLEPSKPLDVSLEIGAYLLHSDLPNGVPVTRTFEIDANDAKRVITLNTKDEQNLPLIPKGSSLSTRSLAGLDSTPETRSRSASWAATSLPKNPFYEYVDAVRPASLPDEGDPPEWDRLWLRLWNYDPERYPVWEQQNLATGLERVDFDGKALALRWTPPMDLFTRGKPFFLELGGYQAVSRFSSVPPANSCDLIVRSSYNPTLLNGGLSLKAVVSRSADAQTQLLVQYLERGSLDAAQSIFEHNVTRLLNNDISDPFGALVGTYYLLKFHVSPWPKLDKIENLLKEFLLRFVASPDVPLLYAWLLLERPPSQRPDTDWIGEAKSNLTESVRRGIPSFAMGLRYLSDTIRTVIAGETLSDENRAKLKTASKRLGRYLQATDESQLLTTYFARAPWVPDDKEEVELPDPDPRIQLKSFL